MKHQNKPKEWDNDLGAHLMFELASVDMSEEQLGETEFEVLKTGEYYDPRYGKFQVTQTRLENLKKNFDEKVLGVDVALDTNHEWDKGAFAWVSELYIKGSSLYAKFRNFTEEGKKLFLEKKFRYFSVEFAPFTKVVDGKKETFGDVLRGIALTNRPVIKGMQPTFMSEGTQTNLLKRNQDTMKNAVILFGDRLLTREKIAKADVEDLKLMLGQLSEDEQKEAQPKVDEVEAKATEQEAAAKAEEDKKAEEGKGAADADKAELSELRKSDEEKGKRLAELEAKEATRELEASVAGVMLSENNTTGFVADKKEAVAEFMKGLSAEQRVAFSELVGGVTTVDAKMFSEAGHGGAGKVDTDKEAAALKLADEKMKANPGMKKHEALAAAYKETGLVTA